MVVDILIKGIHKILGFSNKHYMNMRSKIGVFKPRAFNSSLVLSKPKNLKDSLRVSEWKDAMQKKFDALLQNGTWKLVSFIVNKNTIKYKWGFCVKLRANGELEHYKAYLISKCNLYVETLDYSKSFFSFQKTYHN